MTLAEEYRRDGMIRRTFALDNLGVLAGLSQDAPRFEEMAAAYRQAGQKRVPYKVTPAIEEVARDASLTAVVREVLRTPDALVMWGPNLRTGTPNEAHEWHTDLESLHWPSVTVVVGVARCAPGQSTLCVPGSHHWLAARLQSRAARPAECAAGFADGRFYLFNARCWHRGQAAANREGRIALFLHYQRAQDRRIPLMLDYERPTWSSESAPYLVIGPGPAERRMHGWPWRYRLRQWVRRAGSQGRAS